MTRAISRRSFLKVLTLSGAAAAIPKSAQAISRVDEDRELATLLDITKCIACGACVEACREVNAAKYPVPEKPFPAMVPKDKATPEDWSDSEKREVRDRLTPYNWLFIQTITGKHQGKPFELNIPRRCLHCQNPPCANLCPWGSAWKEDNGIVRIDPVTCLGGAKCKSVCPWSIPQRQTGVGLYKRILPKYAGNGVMYKCDRCFNRIAEGKLPACIEVCPENVQQIGPRREMKEKALQLAKDLNGFVYGLEDNGGTNTFYVSSVPFEVLHTAAVKAPGRPHFKSVPDTMAKEEVLGTAVMLAPVAGIVGAVLKAGKSLSNQAQSPKGDHHE